MNLPQVETPKLIQLVGEHPCLWNSDMTEFSMRNAQNAAWSAIARELWSTWDYLNPLEKRDAQRALRKKWRNLRDYYKMYMSSYRNKNSHNKKYAFADLISFLDPYLGVEDNNSSMEMCEEVGNDNVEKLLHFTQEDDCVVILAEREEPEKKKRALTTEKTLQQDLNCHCHKKDGNVLFLLSFAEEMQSMALDERLNFKSGMLELLARVKNSNE